MLEVLTNMFTRRDPKQEAALGLARIMTRYDMTRLSYDEGIREDRRHRHERTVALGVWLFPCSKSSLGEDFNTSTGIPAVTHDLRPEGFGIMTPIRSPHEYFIVATCEEGESVWRFFKCLARHNTKQPGGWYKLGLQVERLIVLEGGQRAGFHEHVASVHARIARTVSENPVSQTSS